MFPDDDGRCFENKWDWKVLGLIPTFSSKNCIIKTVSIYFATGKKHIHEFTIEQDYLNYCTMLKNKYGSAYFEMSWPNKKIFMVFRDMQDNEYEIRYTPLTIARYSRLMESNPWRWGGMPGKHLDCASGYGLTPLLSSKFIYSFEEDSKE